MKKITVVAVLLALMMSALPATAVPQLSGELIDAAIIAVDYLTSGEYERLVTLLPFSGTAPGAAEWERFSRNYGKNAASAHDGACAFRKGRCWYIAVPLYNPDGETEALILSSEDGLSFTGYRYATWDKVEAECAASGNVLYY